jgi:hypothetical protein
MGILRKNMKKKKTVLIQNSVHKTAMIWNIFMSTFGIGLSELI